MLRLAWWCVSADDMSEDGQTVLDWIRALFVPMSNGVQSQHRC